MGLLERVKAGVAASVPVTEVPVPAHVARQDQPSVSLVPGKDSRKQPATRVGEQPTAKSKHQAASRYIPRAVRRQVAERDGGRCAFVDASGNRCTSTANLEYHHIVPHALHGPPTVENTSLRCRPHNLHQATLDFGEEVVQRAISRSRARSHMHSNGCDVASMP